MARETSLSLQVKYWGLAGMQTAPAPRCLGVCLPDTRTAGSTTSLQVIQIIQWSRNLYEQLFSNIQ